MRKILGATGLAAVALAVAACGSSGGAAASGSSGLPATAAPSQATTSAAAPSPAASSPAASSAADPVLATKTINGTVVLTSSSGLTLYWFSTDTATTSTCTGQCLSYWPPVPGPATAGPGVTGKLATLTGAGGSLQATYDGHPLYTFAGDSAPGQAKGNGVKDSGGVWHEMTASAPATPATAAPAPAARATSQAPPPPAPTPAKSTSGGGGYGY